MRSPAAPRYPSSGIGTGSVLYRLAVECQGVILRLLIYMGGVAVLVTAAVHLFGNDASEQSGEPPVKAGWTAAPRSHPAFAVSRLDPLNKSETYDIFRHPEGGRKDVIRWAAGTDSKPVAELELYRPGAEIDRAGPPAADIAARMDPGGFSEIIGEGIVDSKFGPVTLLGLTERMHDAKRCLGFMKNLENGNLRISGWSCQGDTLPARRSAIACMFNRIVLLTAGKDPTIAEVFARAELKRMSCGTGPGVAATSADWVTGAQNPLLRGRL